jgi:predicted membrane-bound mannosyltransferase
MGAYSYYLGLYAADFLLFLVTMLIFGGSVFLFNLQIYKSQIFEFGLLMLSFGAVLIPFTYLFQHWFKNSDSAFRFVGLVYVLLGILVPTLLVIVFAIATLGQPQGIYFARGLCFFFDPFFTFYEGVSNLIFEYASAKFFPDN